MSQRKRKKWLKKIKPEHLHCFEFTKGYLENGTYPVIQHRELWSTSRPYWAKPISKVLIKWPKL